MARFGMLQLRDRALAAFEEAALQAEKEAVPKTLSLRFALAFLSNFAEERWPFDAFWKAVTSPVEGNEFVQFGRLRSIRNGLNGIYHQLGVKRA